MLATLVLVAGVPCAGLDSGMSIQWVIGQDAMGATVLWDEPCRIMAHSLGLATPMMAARVAGSSG
ncbi:hypothetical protein [Flavisphingomonas formosensis]|uniref:hypothetical protein n=1 Tax=Flavisphingomonas formosensis TaxID=861534 RepID=UPI0018DF9F24|nr:hypothetical protein [Sphingomonas formosensis]